MEKILASHKKKTIQLQELQEKINDKDYLNSVNVIMELIELKRLIPIKALDTDQSRWDKWAKTRIMAKVSDTRTYNTSRRFICIERNN